MLKKLYISLMTKQLKNKEFMEILYNDLTWTEVQTKSFKKYLHFSLWDILCCFWRSISDNHSVRAEVPFLWGGFGGVKDPNLPAGQR